MSQLPSSQYGRTSNTLGLIAQIHAEEAASLFERRVAFVNAPDADLSGLSRLDRRLAAHLDGVAVSGGPADSPVDAASSRSDGDIFAAAVGMIESGESLPEWLWTSNADSSAATLIAAFEWTDRRYLQEVVRELLKSREPVRRLVGVATCAAHRADPGLKNGPWLRDPSFPVRAAALRAVGELGCSALAPLAADWMAEEDPGYRFWASWSAVILGDQETALSALKDAGLDPGPNRARAFRLALQAMRPDRAHEYLAGLAGDEGQSRWVIQGSGVAGDPAYVPWLIRQISEARHARVAAEAFTLVTGADLNKTELWRQPPENFESGPNDDPADPNVEMDPDEGLPWPDPTKVEDWWQSNQGRFQKGTRYFMGQPVTREHCVHVLKNGYQRQRILAAQYLCLLKPGTPLFNTAAPAWRQQRLLAAM